MKEKNQEAYIYIEPLVANIALGAVSLAFWTVKPPSFL